MAVLTLIMTVFGRQTVDAIFGRETWNNTPQKIRDSVYNYTGGMHFRRGLIIIPIDFIYYQQVYKEYSEDEFIEKLTINIAHETIHYAIEECIEDLPRTKEAEEKILLLMGFGSGETLQDAMKRI